MEVAPGAGRNPFTARRDETMFHVGVQRAFAIGLMAVALAGGCSEKKSNGGSTAKATEGPPVDMTAINGAVPKELGGKLTFAAATAEDGDLAVVAPAGWEESKHMPGHWKPASDSSFGFMT